MKIVTPSCYPQFRCIASACRHSCCTGWDVMVDDDAIEKWETEAPELLASVTDSEDGPCFRMRPDGRCPYLRDDGLCAMIVDHGEDILCDICADHPRFRSWFSDRVEIGLGLCCEAAAKLILEQKEPMRLTVSEDDAREEPLTDEERELLELRDAVIRGLTDRSLPYTDRFCRMLEQTGTALPIWPRKKTARFLSGLEIMSDEWRECIDRLENVNNAFFEIWDEEWEIRFEQLCVYLIFRHLPEALDDGDIEGKILFCAFFASLMVMMMGTQQDRSPERFEELCRLASAELEYSDENPGRIADALRS